MKLTLMQILTPKVTTVAFHDFYAGELKVMGKHGNIQVPRLTKRVTGIC